LASPRDGSSAAGWNPGLRFDDFLPGMVLEIRLIALLLVFQPALDSKDPIALSPVHR
jgi:hypothetical protein